MTSYDFLFPAFLLGMPGHIYDIVTASFGS
jgi:hypothetical protein